MRRLGVVLLGALVLPLAGFGVAMAVPGETSFGDTTSVGVHNSYEKSTFPYFADALDSGASLLELDLWTNGGGVDWRVSHSNPFASESNCVGTQDATGPRAGSSGSSSSGQGFAGCLEDMRAWHDSHPEHPPVMIKLELKDGFTAGYGRGPADLDALILNTLGDAVFTPADLVGDQFATPDDAVTQRGWPSVNAMAGKFIFELIPGTIEEKNPLDTWWTDVEYATHLRDLAAADRLGYAAAFPAVHGAEVGDPRIARYADPSVRPWFVIFDGDAAKYVSGAIDLNWYNERGYLLIMTDAQNVTPAIDGTHASEGEAQDRLDRLAGDHASYITSDWSRLPSVLATVVPRR
ncbi:phosphatidylinositol-specific phospholipase C domain-containing protein [Rhodococcus sp. IEGM 1379]|uniref:phosphatidylinositol-specific phospholipase C domain-containing protein n=1 Tax=Rhodococcus sp. IEGM 1379 TaxID=3047086 RepID=UPI0024B863AC|nr:phosphatidylinositol-specific phospholipase C domain-containing protein [Rhodococcus sp. IEGM 1379]MDI9917169.1 phosphatidylinositol-specific phospholipase C domain-containing protein [Rhodococcus sp. IEGM 1379]